MLVPQQSAVNDEWPCRTTSAVMILNHKMEIVYHREKSDNTTNQNWRAKTDVIIRKYRKKYVSLNCSRYQSLPHVTNLIQKKCARYHRYHLHPLCFIEKSNRYQSLPHVTSLLHKICSRCKQIGPKTGRHSLLQLHYIRVGQRLTGHCRIKLSHSMSQWTPSL